MALLAQRRRSTRHWVHLSCQVVRESDFRLIADKILDLSVSGMLVGTSLRVLTGETLLLSFQSPRWGLWVDAEALVARVAHGRRRGETGRALGLEFTTLDDWSRYVLEHDLGAMPPRPPRPTRADQRASRDRPTRWAETATAR